MVAGCGSSQPKNAAPSHQRVNAAFKGSPAPLASLHDQANQLLGGGPTAFDARIAPLKGYPIVVNKWASWCGPCQTEFPVFQRAAVALGKRSRSWASMARTRTRPRPRSCASSR